MFLIFQLIVHFITPATGSSILGSWSVVGSKVSFKNDNSKSSEECRMVNMQIDAKSPSITVMHHIETCVHCSSNLAITEVLTDKSPSSRSSADTAQGCKDTLMMTRGLG